jgi:hypothetical protein
MEFAATVIVTVWREDPARLYRLLGALTRQDVDGGIELVLAADPREAAPLRGLRPAGAVRRIVVVDNPGGARSSGLNLAAALASAPVVCRLDARSMPEPGHVRRGVARLAEDARVGVVGGSQRPRAAGPSAAARGTARALANPWLLGAPAYRRTGRSGPVDTVYLGCFRRQELLDLGGYDERLEANEDFELASRYRHSGRVVWLEDGLEVGYEARDSIEAVFRQYFAFGRSKVRYWRVRGDRPNARQLVAVAGGLAGVAVIAASITRPRRLAALALAAVGAFAILDEAANPDERRVDVRLFSVAASAAVVGGWLTGLAVEAAARPAAPATPARDSAAGSP